MQTFRVGLVICFLLSCRAWSQPVVYAGAGAGASTLSADGQFALDRFPLVMSQYKPENGLLFSAFAGVHLFEYVSLQADYTENRNDVRLLSLQSPATSYDQARESRQNAFLGSFLIYFRGRDSWVRPFLSAGLGTVLLESKATKVSSSSGAPMVPPEEITSTKLGFRSTAGVDVRLRPGLRFRYTFSETITGNAFSRQLTPPGQRNLANFQSLFGLLWEFHRP